MRGCSTHIVSEPRKEDATTVRNQHKINIVCVDTDQRWGGKPRLGTLNF